MASLMEELITTLREEIAAYQDVLPIVEQKTQAIIDNALPKLQEITDLEQESISRIAALERKRSTVLDNMSIVLNKKREELTLTTLISVLGRQPKEQAELTAIRAELNDLLKRIAEVNGHNQNLIEQSLEMISYNMNLIQSTRIVPGNNYTKNAGQWDMTASQTGMFDAKQ